MKLRILYVAAAILLPGLLQAQDNVALGKPVHEIGGPFGIGVDAPGVSPSVVTDGHFLPPGTDFFHGSWWIDWVCVHHPHHEPGQPPPPPEPCALEIDLEGFFQIDSFMFQGDNDQYVVEYWNDASPGWQLAWHMPAISGASGMYTRPLEELPIAIIANRLRIIGNGGDLQYGVSELQAFGNPVDPCTAGGGTPSGGGCWSEEPEFEFHASTGDLCYRFEVACDGFVNGGYGACVYPNGFFDLGMHAQVGDPHDFVPVEPGCWVGGVHMLNDKVERSCSLEGHGKINLEVKQVNWRHCEMSDNNDDDEESDDD